MNPLLFATCALLLLGAFSAPTHAQSITFAGVQTTVPASGLYYPFGVAVDAAGDVFIADTYNSRVVKIPAGGGAQTTVGSGLNMPGGVAVDGAGDVFIADAYNSRVVEVPAGGGAQTTVGSGLSYPYGVAVDAAGDVFITDSGNNRVVEVPASGGPQTTVPASGLKYPIGVAVDGAGDVFIGDAGNSRVVEVPASGGPQTTVPASGLSSPYGVAVDGAGDVFIADHVNNLVVEVPASGGAQTTVGSGLYNPVGVAVDGAGDVFIADTDNNRVVEVQRVAVNFGNVNVCPAGQTTPAPCSQTLTLNYDVAATTTFGTINVVTQGAPNLDFTLSSGGTCTGTVSAGSSCTVNVTFAPLAPGVRMGAVQITDNLGNLLVTTMVHGVAQGPAIAFGPGVQTTVPASGLLYPGSVVVDAAGDVLVADIGNSRVVQVTPNGVQTTVPASGLNQPYGVAVDGAGDVFIADQNNGRVVEVTPGGIQNTVPASGLIYPASVAVDGAGDVFIADVNNNRVVEVTPNGVQTTVPTSGLNSPYGVAVDAAGDVFVADSGNNRVVEVTPSGVQTTVGNGLISPQGVGVDAAGDVFIAGNYQVVEVTPSGVQTAVGAIGLNQPRAVAVDGAGDVFIADTQNNRVVEVQRAQPPTLSFASTAVGSTSSDSPQSVTIQNIGNQPLNAVTPGLVVGGPNFLQVAGPGTPADCTNAFALTPGAACNLSISFEPQSIGPLTAAATFTDNALNTIPSASQSIALQGTGLASTVSVTVGTSPAGLAFSVDGTTYGSAQTFTWTNGSLHTIATVSPQTPVAGTQYTFTSWSDGGALSHSVTASGSTTSYTALFSTQYLLTTAVSPAGSGTVSPLSGYQAAGSSVPLVATTTPYSGKAFSNWTGNVANAKSASTTVIMSAPETVTANFINVTATALVSSLNPSTYAQSVTFTATVTSSDGGRPTGTITFTDGPNALGVVALSNGQAVLTTSMLGAGSHSIVASYSGDSANQANTSTALTQTVQMASMTLGLASNINPSGYNQAVTFTAALTPKFGGSATGTVTFKDGVNTLGTAAVSGNLATITVSTLAVGTHAITAAYGGDTNFTGSSSGTVSQLVNKAGTTTVVASSLNPALVTQSITYTATITSQYGGMVSGSVVFKSGGASLGSATLVNGQASVSTSFSTAGSRSITATYVGDANNTGSTSPALKQVVNKFTTSTSVTSSLNPSLVGQSVTFTATVSSAYGAIPDGEMVTFKNGGSALGTVALSGGTATLNTSTLTAGPHSITVTYAGDTLFAGSVSAVLAQVVNKNPSSTTVASSLNPSSFGQVVTFTATVTTSGSPTGTVTFKSGTATLGTVALMGNTASLSTSALAGGTRLITATYNGDAAFNASTSPVLDQVVNKALTAESLASSQNPSAPGQAVTFTATVTSSGGVPTGTVTFKHGATILGTGTLSGGVATFTTSSLAAGSNTITAHYGGSANYATSSASVTQVVQ
jgi:DNA-binding beta-propeller fold protein YncE